MRWLVIAAATVIGFVGLLFGYGAFRSVDGLQFLGLAFVLVGWMPVIFVHELGHAVAAALAGWRVWIFHVAPLALWTHPFAIRLVGDMNGPDSGGFVLALPGSAAVDTWRRKAWVSAGGPIASWAFAVFCFSLSAWAAPQFAENDVRRYFGDPVWTGSVTMAAGLGFYSVAAALLTSWPMQRKGDRGNDALHILQVLRSQRGMGGEQAAPAMARPLWAYGVPQYAVDRWIRDAISRTSGDTAQGAQILFTDVLDALARCDDAQTRAAIGRLLQVYPDSAEASVLRGFEAAWFDGDVASADHALSAAGGFEQDSDIFRVRQMALATVLRLEDDIEGAERVVNSISASAITHWGFYGSAWDALARH